MPVATNSEALREYADNAGRDNPTSAWICTPWDTWERNPHYRGPPVRHPEDFDWDEEITTLLKTGPEEYESHQKRIEEAMIHLLGNQDDIPF